MRELALSSSLARLCHFYDRAHSLCMARLRRRLHVPGVAQSSLGGSDARLRSGVSVVGQRNPVDQLLVRGGEPDVRGHRDLLDRRDYCLAFAKIEQQP
jgi:hypothetical protein